MKIKRGELKKLIAEELEAAQMSEGVMDWIQGIFTSEDEIHELADRFKMYYDKLNEFVESDGPIGAEGSYDTWDPEKDDDRGGRVTKQHQQASMSFDPEYEEQWDQIIAFLKTARESLRALDYTSVQGFWNKPKKLDYLYKGLDAVQKALGIISKTDRSYREIEAQARADAGKAAKARVQKRSDDRMDRVASDRAKRVYDSERNRRDRAERERNRADRGMQFTGGQMSMNSPYMESVDREELQRIIAEELKSLLEEK